MPSQRGGSTSPRPRSKIPIASTLRLTAIVRDASGRPVSDAPVTWSSSDRAIAAVDLRGLVTGISQGVVSIAVTSTRPKARGTARVGIQSGDVTLQVVAGGLEFPITLASPPGDENRLFVLERPGTIRIIKSGNVLARPFLDISPKVEPTLEGGLVGLAFHPDYSDNGHFFIYYMHRENEAYGTRLVRYSVSSDNPDVADPDSDLLILHMPQRTGSHIGGQVAFGPDDMLYLGLGDGGFDTADSAQDISSLRGSILRLDVDSPDPGLHYGIPDDNPFVVSNDTANGARGEIWLYGFRNPWRFSFDRLTGDLYIGDVGNNRREEVSVFPASASSGANFGWPIKEGPRSDCNPDNQLNLVDPIVVVERSDGCSVISGYVYRGREISKLHGAYFYSDWCGGWFRSLRYDGATAQDQLDWTPDLGSIEFASLVSFGEDGAGELYVSASLSGFVYRIAPP